MRKEPVYGFPCVEDPHDFSPDVDCCSPAEIAAWERACETYGTPEYQPNKGCYAEYDVGGQLVLRVTRTSWGIGVNYVEIDEPSECIHGKPIDAECDECRAVMSFGRLVEDSE